MAKHVLILWGAQSSYVPTMHDFEDHMDSALESAGIAVYDHDVDVTGVRLCDPEHDALFKRRLTDWTLFHFYTLRQFVYYPESDSASRRSNKELLMDIADVEKTHDPVDLFALFGSTGQRSFWSAISELLNERGHRVSLWIGEVIVDIIAIDPGLVSGYAWVRATPDRPTTTTVLRSGEFSPIDVGEVLRSDMDALLLEDALDDLTVVVERFTITPKTGANTQAPWSLEVIGQTKWIVHQFLPGRDPLVRLQTPADAKATMPNPRLREIGLWHRGGKGHALDALRHAGLFLHRSGLLAPRMVAQDE